jgi:hypothetical protein
MPVARRRWHSWPARLRKKIRLLEEAFTGYSPAHHAFVLTQMLGRSL